MNEMILTLNAGSSSVKFALFKAQSDPELVASGQVQGIGTAPHFVAKDHEGGLLSESYWEPIGLEAGHSRAFQQISRWLREFLQEERIMAVGHRVAHGGPEYSEAVLINEEVIARLTHLIPLAPLHQPHHLAAIRAATKANAEMPQVACFDTSFHRQRPAVSERLALPSEYHARGIRRYGFHGLSYEYITTRMRKIAPEQADGRIVVAHLGSGCSMCATKRGKSIETTMSFSALDGVPMGTRCGALDPGVLLYLMQQDGMTITELEDLLYKRSGLLGISGVSNDMRALHDSDDPLAREAIDYFVYRVGQELGALAASLGGIDALVFTAGIGENDAEIRRRVCENAAWLGIALDTEANERGETLISNGEAPPAVWVIPTNEERMIAMHTVELVARRDSTGRVIVRN